MSGIGAIEDGDNMAANNKAVIFGRNVCRLRKERKLTQKRLAELANIEQGTLSRVETGKMNFTCQLEVALAEALGVSIAELWKEGE